MVGERGSRRRAEDRSRCAAATGVAGPPAPPPECRRQSRHRVRLRSATRPALRKLRGLRNLRHLRLARRQCAGRKRSIGDGVGEHLRLDRQADDADDHRAKKVPSDTIAHVHGRLGQWAIAARRRTLLGTGIRVWARPSRTAVARRHDHGEQQAHQRRPGHHSTRPRPATSFWPYGYTNATSHACCERMAKFCFCPWWWTGAARFRPIIRKCCAKDTRSPEEPWSLTTADTDGAPTWHRSTRERAAISGFWCLAGAGGWLCVTVLVFYPGYVTVDARYVYADAMAWQFGDWQSPAMGVLWRLIDPIAPGSLSMFLLTVTLYWLGFGLVATHRGAARGMARQSRRCCSR